MNENQRPGNYAGVVTEEQAAQSSNGSGTKTFEQSIVPLKSGAQEIPELRFSYFDPDAQSYVTKTTSPIAVKIAKSLDKEPGAIRIDGYSDTDPIKTVTFPSNWELSEARAKSVAGVLKTDLSQPLRVTVSGKGSDNPVAPNDTVENKAKNRRVEISIPRAD